MVESAARLRAGQFVCVYSVTWMGLRHSRGVRKERVVKVQASVKPRCEYCKIIKRKGVLRVICSRQPKHKQRQG